MWSLLGCLNPEIKIKMVNTVQLPNKLRIYFTIGNLDYMVVTSAAPLNQQQLPIVWDGNIAECFEETCLEKHDNPRVPKGIPLAGVLAPFKKHRLLNDDELEAIRFALLPKWGYIQSVVKLERKNLSPQLYLPALD